MKLVGKVAIILLVVSSGVGYFFTNRWGMPFASTSHARSGDRVNGIVVTNDTQVSATIDGRIGILHVDEGSEVKKGDLVATIVLEEAAAQKRDQQAGIDQLSIKADRNRENVNLERERVSGQVTRASALLASAESESKLAAQELDQVQRDAKRAEQLLGEGVLAKQDAERARSNVEVAQSRLRTLQDKVSAAKAELELARTNERQISIATRDVALTEAELKQARARMSQLLTRIGYAEVRAPLSGIVSIRIAREGEVVKVGSPIVTIVDLDNIWVKASFEETHASQIGLGQELPVQLASGEEIRGKVIQIAPESDFATQRDFSRMKRDIRTFGIKARIKNPNHRIYPGMTAYITLPASDAPKPAAADR